jgi:HEAT repeat protein
LLVGRPGSGKSTTLARLLLEEARACLPFLADHPAIDPFSNPLLGGARGGLVSGDFDRPTPPSGHPSEEGIVRVTDFSSDSHGLGRIPVLVELRFLSDSTLLDRIQAFFQRHGLQLDRTQIEDLLFHQRLLLLMDGLNELPSEAARLDVAKFRQDYPKVSMIFTKRELSLGGDFGLEKKLEMQPLTEAQMEKFVRSYVPEQAEAMLRQLKDRLREFGQTPLMLWMLCGLFRQTGQIPANLGEVFRAFTQGYEKHLKADVPVESDRRWWPELLQELAFWMMRGVPFGEEAPVLDIDFRAAVSKKEVRQIFTAFLQNKEAQAEGIAQKYLDDLLRHHLIQSNGEQIEFRHQLLQEYYAAEYLLAHWGQISEFEFKRDYLNYLKWTEAIALMVGLIDSEKLVLQIVDSALGLDLMLGARLAGEVKPELQPTTVGWVSALEIPEWLKIELLGKTRSDEAIPILLKALEDDYDYVCGNVADAIGQVGSRTAISGLFTALKNKNPSVRRNAAYALGQIGSEKAILALLQALGDEAPYVRMDAAESLGQIGSDQAIPGLLKALKDKDSLVRSIVAESLGQIGSDRAIPGLLEVLKEKDPDVCWSASRALEYLSSEKVVPDVLKADVLKALEGIHFFIHWNTVEASVHIGSEKTTPELLIAVEDENSSVRWVVAEELLIALEDEDSNVHFRAAEVLGQLDLDQTIPALLKAFADENSSVRWVSWVAADLLGNIKNVAIACILPQLIALIPTPSGEEAFSAMSAIQSNCKFYNYELTQTTQSMKLFFSYTHKDEPLLDELASSFAPITYNDFRGANIGNFAENVYGTQQTIQIPPSPADPSSTPSPETPQ